MTRIFPVSRQDENQRSYPVDSHTGVSGTHCRQFPVLNRPV